MSNDNIISFEEYRRKKAGKNYREDDLSAIFRKDLREQEDLTDWYLFHNTFNKHKLFVHTIFYENHIQKIPNPNSGYVIAFFDEIYPSSDLIFVDYADFLQNSWESVGTYLSILA